MSSSASNSLSGLVAPAVRDFLKTHGVDEEFQRVEQLVHSSFPELRSWQACLQEDPDDEGRTTVIFQVALPLEHSPERLQAQRRDFSERFVQVISLKHCPLFGLQIRFA